MDLFQLGDFILASGARSEFKIDCDALSDNGLECLAYLLARRCGWFAWAVGVPRGGLRLANAINAGAYYTKHVTNAPTLIVDDVLTTGASMELLRRRFPKARGGVLFARGPCPDWITPLFRLEPLK